MDTMTPLTGPRPAHPGQAHPAQAHSVPVIGRPSPQLVAEVASYLHPGVLFFQNGAWEGGDHLLNLTNNIGVYVTIVKPEGDPFPLTEEQLKKIVDDQFKAVKINPVTLAVQGEPPLPAFQIQILAYPIEKGYVVACEGRLFESVTLKRVILDAGLAFQAITWEKKSLQVGPTDKIGEQIIGCVGDIAQSFAERFDAYEKRKRDLK